MGQRIFIIGTTPLQVARFNPERASITLSMPPTSAFAPNTGIIYVGKGFPPVATAGAPNAGDPITQGTQYTEVPQFQGDPSMFLGNMWAVADTAGQQLVVDETYKSGMGR